MMKRHREAPKCSIWTRQSDIDTEHQFAAVNGKPATSVPLFPSTEVASLRLMDADKTNSFVLSAFIGLTGPFTGASAVYRRPVSHAAEWLLIVVRFLGVIDNHHFNFAVCRFQFQSDLLDCRENIRAIDIGGGHTRRRRE